MQRARSSDSKGRERRYDLERINEPARRKGNTLQVKIKGHSWTLGSCKSPNNYGAVELDDRINEALQDVRLKRRGKNKLRVQFINPKILENLDRTRKVQLLKYLSEPTKRMNLVKGKYKKLSKRVDHATIMILSLALRLPQDREHNKLLGELIGLSQPNTIGFLKDLELVTPLMRPEMITSLAHAAARNLTQRRQGQYGPRSLPQAVSVFIARIATKMNLEKESNEKLLGKTLRNLAQSWPKRKDKRAARIKENDPDEGEDRVYQIGMVLAGIKRSLHARMVTKMRKYEKFKTFVQCVLKGLAGIGDGAGAVNALDPLVQLFSEKITKKAKELAKEMWDNIYKCYLTDVETKVRREGEYQASWDKYTKVLD